MFLSNVKSVHKHGLTHISLVRTLGPSVKVCALSIANIILHNWPVGFVLFYII